MGYSVYGWDNDDTTVIRRQLGFYSITSVIAYRSARNGQGTGLIWLSIGFLVLEINEPIT